jgi:hypothetical protein
MTYDEAIPDLENKLYGLITDLTSLPIRFRNSSPQKLNEQHIQLHIANIEDVGWYHGGDYDENGAAITQKEYEVDVDVACHAGTRTQTVLQKILHTISASSGLYYKYFDEGNISFLRASRTTRRDWPLDKIQWEERSQITMVFSMVVDMVDDFDVGTIETVQVSSLKTKITENNVAVEDTLTITYP